MQSKPDTANCSFVGRLAVANEDAIYRANVARFHVHLGEGVLWLSRDLVVPISAIRAKEMIERMDFVPRVALRIVYDDSKRGRRESIQLCDISFLGYYRRESLEALSDAIEVAHVETDAGASAPLESNAELPAHTRSSDLIRRLFDAILDLARPRRTEIRYYRQLAELWNIRTSHLWRTPEQARSAVLEHASATSKTLTLDELDDGSRAHLRVSRALALWMLFWSFVLPVTVSGWWVSTTVGNSLAETMLLITIGVLLLVPLGLFVQAILNRPFACLVNKYLGSLSAHRVRRL